MSSSLHVDPARALTVALPYDVDNLVDQLRLRSAGYSLTNLAAGLPRMHVHASEQGTAGNGLFNDCVKTLVPGAVIAILSSGHMAPKRNPNLVDGGRYVELTTGQFQKFHKKGPKCKAGYYGGSENEDNEGVIVEIDLKKRNSRIPKATILVAVKNIDHAREVLVYYDEDQKDLWTRQHRSAPSRSRGRGGGHIGIGRSGH